MNGTGNGYNLWICFDLLREYNPYEMHEYALSHYIVIRASHHESTYLLVYQIRTNNLQPPLSKKTSNTCKL